MCDLTAGRLEPQCKTVGGLKAFYKFESYVSGLLDSATFAADEEITAFATAITLYKYELRGGTHNFDDNGESSPENGTVFYSQSGSFNLKKQDKTTRKELGLLGRSHSQVIVEDYNGKFRLAGIENGCDVSINSNSGSAMGDSNGYSLTLSAQEKDMAYFVDPSIIGDTTNTVVVVGT